MTTPRELIPYESFGELIRDSFTAYTRTSEMFAQTTEYYSQPVQPTAKLESGGFTARSTSEIDSLMLAQQNIIWKLFDMRDESVKLALQNSSLSINGVTNNTLLHPGNQQTLDKIVRNSDPTSITLDISEEFMINEKCLQDESFKDCDHIALILPEYMCHSYVKAIIEKKPNLSKFISVGKETYSDIDWMLTLEGFEPPYLVLRIKSATSSGIWIRWTRFITGGLVKDASDRRDQVVAASMTGNTIIVFSAWALGGCLAIVSFAVEMSIRAVLKFWASLRKNCGWILCLYGMAFCKRLTLNLTWPSGLAASSFVISLASRNPFIHW